MWYHVYELNHAAIQPIRWAANLGQHILQHPLNPAAYTGFGKQLSAAFDVFETLTRRYGKPEFGIDAVEIKGKSIPIVEEVPWRSTWMHLKHFKKDPEIFSAAMGSEKATYQPPLLIVAPLSGHYATLLRGTVEAMLPDHDVYITDWVDARLIPVLDGRFDLNDYIDTLIRVIREVLPQTHIMAVCQPGPAALSAAALMNEAKDPAAPLSLTIMGSPIDTRESPTEANLLAEERPLRWFRDNMISTVPAPYPGAMRQVYPGFVQLTSFVNLNRERHVDAHWTYFENLIKGDGDSTQKHRDFYDEYLAVMDLTAEFYIQTIDEVFQRHLLPKGAFIHHGQIVRPDLITETALMTVEGENDDISGIGQTQAAHRLCSGLPSSMKIDHVQAGVGHYGVFNGRRFVGEIVPKVTDFIRDHDARRNTNVIPFKKSG